MKALENQIIEIKAVISNNRLVANRITELNEIGYEVSNFPMGGGGVGQVVEMKNCYRVQVSHGTGKHNYADAVVIYKS